MPKPFRAAVFAWALMTVSVRAETLKQDFNSLEDLKAFWDISTWANDNRSHSAQNVSVAGGVLKQVPDQAAAMMLNHWSGNIADWGGPAPLEDMYMDVDWVAYSSDFPTALALPGKRASAYPGYAVAAGAPLLSILPVDGSPRLRVFDLVGRSRPLILYP